MSNLLYERDDPVTLRRTEVEQDGKELVFVHSQDLRPIVEACKRDASNFDPGQWKRTGYVKVASIPAVVAADLKRKGILDDPAQLKAWLDERDNRVFRTDDGRKL